MEGFYEVSNKGRVRSLDRMLATRWKTKVLYKGQILSPRMAATGYNQLALQRAGKRHNLYVARLVAEAFIPNPDGKPEVNHKSGDKMDNSTQNLEWTTHAENVAHSVATGLLHKNKRRKLEAAAAAERQDGP
jgi:hypothetical protein